MRFNKVSLVASAAIVPVLFLSACSNLSGGSGTPLIQGGRLL